MHIQVDDTFAVFAKDDVLALVKQIDVTKPSGIDNVSSGVLKDALQISTGVFHHIMEYSIMTGSLPDSWTTALITPLPKSWKFKRCFKLETHLYPTCP